MEEAGGSRPAKKARVLPPNFENAWGCVVDDVAATMDWALLTTAFDKMTEPSLWTLDVTTHAAVSKHLKLAVVEAAAGAAKLPLLSWLRGGEMIQDRAADENKLDAHPLFLLSSSVALEDVPGKGRGWFAKKLVRAGSIVLVEKPLVATLDGEWRSEKWADCAGSDTAALSLKLAKSYSKSLEKCIAKLHPPEGADAQPPSDDDDDDPEEKDALLEAVDVAFAGVNGMSPEKQMRLQAVVRLNSLGFYTHSEQICHHGNYTVLTGSGLFALASGFNHACEPNVTRFSLGDITFFVTNRDVAIDEELCISYVEAELLCAPLSMRRQSLNRDFVCGCARCVKDGSVPEAGTVSERRYVQVDAKLQVELSSLSPEDRIGTVESILRGEMPAEDSAEEEDDGDADAADGGDDEEDADGAGCSGEAADSSPRAASSSAGAAASSAGAGHSSKGDAGTRAVAAGSSVGAARSSTGAGSTHANRGNEQEGGNEEEKEDDEEEEDPAGSMIVLGKDAQELRVVQALAHMQLKEFDRALELWRRLAAFTCHHCPCFDEALPVYATQAALCAIASGASGKEVEQAYVSEKVQQQFWDVVGRAESRSAGTAWPEVSAAWKFLPDEIPGITGP